MELRALKECSKCHGMKFKEEYSAAQLAVGTRRVCNDCQQSERRLKCSRCNTPKTQVEYNVRQWGQGRARMCEDCLHLLTCSQCRARKAPQCYAPSERKKGTRARICEECAAKQTGALKKRGRPKRLASPVGP